MQTHSIRTPYLILSTPGVADMISFINVCIGEEDLTWNVKPAKQDELFY